MVRIKHRYLLVNILYPAKDTDKARGQKEDDIPYAVQFRRPSPDRMDGKLLLKMIRDGVSELFGDYGSGMIAGSLQVKYFSQATSTAIIRVSRDHYRLVWAALTFTTHLPKPIEQPCVMQVVRVSGTIKKAEEEAIRRARSSIKRAQRPARQDGAMHAMDGHFIAINEKHGGFNDLLGFEDGIEDRDDPSELEDNDGNDE